MSIVSWADYGITGEVTVGRPAAAAPYKRQIQRRIDKALSDIDRLAVSTDGHFYSAISFGADSLVADHLMRRYYPDHPAMWVNQGPLAEWPDCLALKDQMVANGLPLVELTPDVTLYDWYRLHGIPTSSAMDSKDDKELNEALMYAPIRRYQESSAARGYLWGLRYDGEGNHRRILIQSRGTLYHRKTDGQYVCSPVGHWSKHEIWAYIDLFALPYAKMYDIDRLEIRNGPPIGTSALNMGRIVKLKHNFPHIWRVAISEFPELQRYT
jgi:3'-phosphoadenosine 5'-phosphosulfate sulfotransferase (PAPS reductase)/FAD synthetase